RIRSVLELEEVGQQLASLSQATLVEGVGVLRTLEPDVDRPGEPAGAHTGEIAHMRGEARGGIDRARAADRDEEIAARHRGADLVHPFRNLAEPHHVRPEQGSAVAPRPPAKEPFRSGHVLDAVLLPQPTRVAEGADAALRADPGPGENEHPGPAPDRDRRERGSGSHARERNHRASWLRAARSRARSDP